MTWVTCGTTHLLWMNWHLKDSFLHHSHSFRQWRYTDSVLHVLPNEKVPNGQVWLSQEQLADHHVILTRMVSQPVWQELCEKNGQQNASAVVPHLAEKDSLSELVAESTRWVAFPGNLGQYWFAPQRWNDHRQGCFDMTQNTLNFAGSCSTSKVPCQF